MNQQNKVVIESADKTLTYERIASGILHCTCAVAGSKASPSPLGIEPLVSGTLEHVITDSCHVVTSDALKVEIDRKSGKTYWSHEKSGKLLFEETDRELTEIPVYEHTTKGEAPEIKRVKTVDGERNFISNLVCETVRTAYRGKLSFAWQKDEKLHGLGQGEEGIYNYRGSTQYLYQHNMRIPIPFLISDRGYGILFDCGSIMTFNDDARGSYLYFDTVDQLSYYVIYGPDFDEIIKGFRGLTGRVPMLPKWSFGYIQSKEAYHTQQELIDVVREYRKRNVPIDGIVQDWNTWEEGKWGNKLLDKSRYPNFPKAIKSIHEDNVHVMVSVWPNMDSSTENYKEFLEKGLLLNDLSTYDAFDPEGRKVYFKQLEEELFSAGVDAWWCDSTEPFSGPDWKGSLKKEPWERFLLVGEEHKKYLDPTKANLYAEVHAKGIYENQREVCQDKRVLNLTRSGYAGSGAYGTVLWSGDITATWETLKVQIREGLNLCMSGHPYWTLDAGGFFVVKDNWKKRGCSSSNDPEPKWFWQGGYELGVDDAAYRELYVRWLQFSLFLPMFRSHGTDTPREIWNFGEPGSPFYDSIEQCIRLRYQLMPYTYSLAGRVMLHDYTMFRSLLFDFAEDEIASEISSQFMYGDSLLVCPVIEPMYYEAENKFLDRERTWRCYLPDGSSWYDYFTGDHYEGGQWVTAQAPIEKIPVFVREGAIIPMEAGLDYAGEVVHTPFEFHVYEGKDGSFHLYEDSGDGYDYEAGIYNYILISWDDRKKELCIGESKYSFPQSIWGRDCVLRTSGGREVFFSYDGKETRVKLEENET
ncbi:glycoside hydrolase family 31 protein [Lacrimispora algidixylanolytica]|uniref:glycoside hydrolase family 31 protein n=1 Tax=Lacrimispora algidixylanolytica TaxID=94868 RepID=UPI001FA9509F|nr:TIM-barrel domain-containing protein [Lacrimispora algidixylanolytica]